MIDERIKNATARSFLQAVAFCIYKSSCFNYFIVHKDFDILSLKYNIYFLLAK